MSKNQQQISLYVDGTAKGKSGVGGWAALIVNAGATNPVESICGSVGDTTSNAMLLKATIEGLKCSEQSR